MDERQSLIEQIEAQLPHPPQLSSVTPLYEDGWLEVTGIGTYVVYIPIVEDDDYMVELRFTRGDDADLIRVARSLFGGET